MATAPTFPIEKGLPVPPKCAGRGGGRKAIYPFREMEVGDSFEVKLEDAKSKSIIALQRTLVKCGIHALGKGAVTTRANAAANGVRVWRVS